MMEETVAAKTIGLPSSNATGKLGAHLDDLMSAVSSRVSFLQQAVVIRSAMLSSRDDLTSLDIAVQAIEHQLRAVKAYLKDEVDALPKAQALIKLSLQQDRRLKVISGVLSANLHGIEPKLHSSESIPQSSELEAINGHPFLKSVENGFQKDKKGRSPPPCLYVTNEELDSLSSYMRGRLTLEKVNKAVDEMATFAEVNAKLLTAPRKKLGNELLEKALELRDFAATECVKGKHFFFESDMKGSVLKMDNTGKAILTVLRHLGRIADVRAGRLRGFILLDP
ncbi:hypothetical protein KP509_18G074900 [Ceratopteris richardii]|uniref:SKA complex subunit 1 homolog n=1 Tax=Ceratopteris richardii TaxID=49495 RepID=A0A8T2SR08_CERRI|nr:hypothetical protein KP509_18G074900 [Ceratopteris richardii]